MDIKEALEKMRQTSATFVQEINDLVNFIGKNEAEVEKMIEKQSTLEASVSNIEISLKEMEEKYQVKVTELAQNFEKQKQNSKEGLKNLKEQANQEYNAAKIACDAKIAELNTKITELKNTAKFLSEEVSGKETLLASLNQAIESIKTRLTIQ